MAALLYNAPRFDEKEIANENFDFLDDMLTYLDSSTPSLEGQVFALEAAQLAEQTPAQQLEQHEQIEQYQQLAHYVNNMSEEDVRKARSKEKARASNRQAQRRTRLKKQAQWQKLETELAEARAALKRLQSERSPHKRPDAITEWRRQAHMPIHHIADHAPAVVDPQVLSQLASIVYTQSGFLHQKLSAQQEYASKQVSRLPHQEMAAMWQDYARRITEGLLATGQDLVGPRGMQLEHDVRDFCALTAAKFRFTPSDWQAALDGSSSESAAAGFGSDPLYMGRMLQFDEVQKATLFTRRRQYVTDIARNSRQRQQLLQQLRQLPEASAAASAKLGSIHMTVEDLTQQLRDCAAEEFELFMDYTVCIGQKIATPWQKAVAIVQAYPFHPDAVAFVNALAEDAGEPSVAVLRHAASGSCHDGQLQDCMGLEPPAAHTHYNPIIEELGFHDRPVVLSLDEDLSRKAIFG